MTDDFDQTSAHTASSSGVAGRVRDGASAAIDQARGGMQAVASRTAETIDGNPLAILVGGLAVGALAGAFIPRSAREAEMLAPVARRLGESARAAARAARDAGTAELAAAGISKAAASEQVQRLVQGLTSAAKRAGTAAADAAKGSGETAAQPASNPPA